MKSKSKKKSKRHPKSTQIEGPPPTDPAPRESTSQSQPETLTYSSESRSRDLACLSDVFSALSVDQIESAYEEAGCDAFKAAGILGTHLEEEEEVEDEGQDRPTVESTVSEGSSQEKPKYTAEESEQFLFSMLGERSDLGMGVVRDILYQCSGNVEKALETLLELSDSSYDPEVRESFMHTAMDCLDYSDIFRGIDCKGPPNGNISSFQMDTSALSNMNWTSVGKKVGKGRHFQQQAKSMSNIKQKQKNSEKDGYHEYRIVAEKYWDMMKTCYQRAAEEYSKGNGSHAAIHAEKGKYYRDLARQEVEVASLEIF